VGVTAAGAIGRTALLSPMRNESNAYIAIHRQLLQQAGYDVQPLSIAALARGGWKHLLSSGNVLLLHWPELRPFDFSGDRVRYRLRGWFEWLAYALIVTVSRAPSVYFVHDHAVHDTQGATRRVSEWMIATFGRLCTRRVVHAPGFAQRYRANYLPHPLYWDVLEGARLCPDSNRDDPAASPSSKPRCSILGAIRRYKGIDGLLEHWPADRALYIAGSGAPDYVEELVRIVRRRGLDRVVTIEPRFLTEAEFDERLGSTDVLILPHRPNTMLVSGAFFEAVGRVPVILARSCGFVDWASTRLEGVHRFDADADIGVAVAAALDHRSAESALADRRTAVREFGLDACIEAYSHFLESVSRSGR
jgi:beta-1,4-mannosyltransferase